MADQPRRVRFRKVHRGRRKGPANSGNTLVFGPFGLQALENAWITSRQIEAARRAITHHMHRGGKVWIRVFPHKPVTSKPAETRQGGGKGAPDHWVAVVKHGHIMFELDGVPEALAREAIRLAGHKLPIGVRFVSREDSTVHAAAARPNGATPAVDADEDASEERTE